ncbi:MAG: FHA domain-containing protein [Pseudomonadota bacterium]
MAKLILSLDGAVLREIVLNKERTTIGRKEHNDVVIDNLAVSGDHAQIVSILNDSFLEDLDSTNGTLVNGNPIKKHFLQNGDVIEIGKYKLKYLNEGAAAGHAAEEFEKTMILRPSAHTPAAPAPNRTGDDTLVNTPAYSPGREEEMTAKVAAMPAGHLPVATIQLLSGPNAGRELELAKTLVTIGKPGVQVAVIARRPHGYFITHVEGANFPVLNGKVLDAQAHPLNDHDVIELAGVKMEFFFKSE